MERSQMEQELAEVMGDDYQDIQSQLDADAEPAAQEEQQQDTDVEDNQQEQSDPNDEPENEQPDTEPKGFEEEAEKILTEAKDLGYNDKYPKDHPRYISPYAYVQNEKLRKANERQWQEQQDQLAAYKKLADARAEQRIKEVQEKMNQAKSDLDFEAYEKHNQELAEAQQEKQQLAQQNKPEPQQQGMHPDVAEWVDKNPWYKDKNDERTQQVEFEMMKLQKEYGENIAKVSPRVILKEIENRLGFSKQQPKQAAYNPRRNAPTATETSREPRGSNNKRGITRADLSRDELDGYERFFKPTGGTMDEYLKAVEADRKING
jgi:hypothetical protein